MIKKNMKKNNHIRYRNHYLNYGFIEKHGRHYRRALRECRKNLKRFGVVFDNSETWSLDVAFMKWLYNQQWLTRDNQNVIRAYGQELMDEYINCNFDIKLTDYQALSETQEELIKRVFSEVEILDIRLKVRIRNFLVPRLIIFKENLHGYPADMTEEEWDTYIDETIKEIEQYKYDKFKERFGNFWD